MNTPSERHCVLYARVSTDKQAEKDLSIPAQLSAMREYAATHGWQVVEEFTEAGASGRTAARPALQQLLSRIRDSTQQTDVVLVHKVDRLARNVYDHATIRALLEQHGVQLASVVENLEDTVPGQLVENIMASIAQFYSANLSEETRKGMRQKVNQGGWPHKPPRGYVVVRDRKGQSSIALHPREAPLMQRAFELYATGWYSIRTLAKRLAADGLISRSGGPIPGSHMHRLLTNDFYIGRVRWKELNVQGTHPPLVSQDLFNKVQQVVRDKYRMPSSSEHAEAFSLRRFAICARCRAHMTGEWHDRWGYYRCCRQSYRRELCDARMCSVRRVNDDLERILKQIQITRALAGEIRARARRLVAYHIAASRSTDGGPERRARKLLTSEVTLTQAFARGDIGADEFRDRSADLRTQRSRQAVQARELTREDATAMERRIDELLDLSTSAWDLYESVSGQRRAELLRAVFENVAIAKEGIVGFSLRSPFEQLAGLSFHGVNPTDTQIRSAAEALVDAA